PLLDPLATNGSNETDGNPFAQPVWRVALWAIAYSLIVVVSVIGNVTIIWIILAHRRMRTVTNYFIVNLAFSDVSMAVFNTVFNFIYAIHNDWYFGTGYCKFQNFFPITAIFASIYSMTAIAVDRYIAIIHPLRPRLSAKTTKIVIGLIWTVAFGLALPQCFYSTLFYHHPRTICMVNWPGDGEHHLVYQLAVILLIYVLPLLVMMVTYSVIGITLWGGAIPGDSSRSYQNQLRAKRKIIKQWKVAILCCAISCLPVSVPVLAQAPPLFKKKIYWQNKINSLYACYKNLLHSVRLKYNDPPTTILVSRFRSGFRCAFRWCPFIRATEDDELELTLTRSFQMTRSYRMSAATTEVCSDHTKVFESTFQGIILV
uniref:Tachykinin receptor 2 n=1 Tax=Latimeria chalumnae TaxID=7897 RepID=H3AQS1_LATCH